MPLEINQSTLPYSLDCEQTVLGTIIIDSSSMNTVATFLRPEHFHVGLHSELFSVIYNMYVAGIPIDLVTIIENAVTQKKLYGNKTLKEKIFESQEEARAYLIKLAESVVNPSSIEDYARIIVEKYTMRSLLYACSDIFNMVIASTEKPSLIMEVAEKRILELRNDGDLRGLTRIDSIISENVSDMEIARANPGKSEKASMSSSFGGVDYYISGLNPAALILIAARPGMGKTSFALNIAAGVAEKYPDKEIAIFSLEMSKKELVSRMISSASEITTDKMKSGFINNEEWDRIVKGVSTLSRLNIYIDEGVNPSIGEMKAKLMRMKNLGLVVIDYLQLMSTGRNDGNRNQEVSEITRSLKLMAKELNVPVIVASQLSRAATQRSEKQKRPQLTDLRDSGSIEQDADIVMFLYRESYDNPQAEDQTTCECIIAKNRQGDTGMVELEWKKEYTRFRDIDHTHNAPDRPF